MSNRPNNDAKIEIGGTSISLFSIQEVVSSFYFKVEKDELLAQPFSDVKDWPHHIELMTHFWWIRLGGERYLDYSYNPIPKHFAKGFNDNLLARWLQLFEETLREKLTEAQVSSWLAVASSIGTFLAKRNLEFMTEQLERLPKGTAPLGAKFRD